MKYIIIIWMSLVMTGCSTETKETVVVECETPDTLMTDNTELTIVNASSDSVLVFLTLSGYPASDSADYVQNVYGVFSITQSGLVGFFYIQAGDSISYTSLKRFSGNISFGSQPLNCFTKEWPTGVNPFEFNLNCGQESIDISAMGGVNSLLGVQLLYGPAWAASPSYPDVRSFQNDSMWQNTGLVGVYPYGCTNCTNTEGKQACQTPNEMPNDIPICNPTRAAGVRGGQVIVTFKGWTNN